MWRKPKGVEPMKVRADDRPRPKMEAIQHITLSRSTLSLTVRSVRVYYVGKSFVVLVVSFFCFGFGFFCFGITCKRSGRESLRVLFSFDLLTAFGKMFWSQLPYFGIDSAGSGLYIAGGADVHLPKELLFRNAS